MRREDDDLNELPALVEAWKQGDSGAFDRVVELVYDDLRAIASRHLRGERAGHTLNTTALVHEAYVALSERTTPGWQGRPQLLALISRVMRHLLIDHARRKRADKRGGDAVFVPLDESNVSSQEQAYEVLAVNEVLERLEVRDERLARIVEYRFFGGMPATEIAEVLGVSPRTVERGWRRARSYLHATLTPPRPAAGQGP